MTRKVFRMQRRVLDRRLCQRPRRLIAASCALLFLLFGCATPPEEEQSSERVSDGTPQKGPTFDHDNQVVTDGVSLRLPREWLVTRQVGGALTARGADGELSLTMTYLERGIGPAEALSGISNRTIEQIVLAGLPASMASTTSGTTQPLPRGVLWHEHDGPPVRIRFNGAPAASATQRTQIETILHEVAFTPYAENMRLREDLFAFHNYGTGWRFHRDTPRGALFVHLSSTAGTGGSWDGKHTMALHLERLTDQEYREARDTAAASKGTTITLDHLGPAVAGQYDVTTQTREDGSRSYVAEPFGAGAAEWRVAVLVAPREDISAENGGIWTDERLTRFFTGCFTPAP